MAKDIKLLSITSPVDLVSGSEDEGVSGRVILGNLYLEATLNLLQQNAAPTLVAVEADVPRDSDERCLVQRLAQQLGPKGVFVLEVPERQVRVLGPEFVGHDVDGVSYGPHAVVCVSVIFAVLLLSRPVVHGLVLCGRHA